MQTSILASGSLALAVVLGCSRDKPAGGADPASIATVIAVPAATATATVPLPATGGQVRRGEYLSAIAGCEGCHTPLDGKGRPDAARLLAGGVEVTDFIGPWRSSNITPDPETGIGRWSDADLGAAIRQGIAPGGRLLDPWMPSHHLRALSDEDLTALVAYLRSVRPVVSPVARLPSKRPARKIEPPPKGPVPPPKSDPVDRGRYLVAIGGCASCHAPAARNGSEAGVALSGGREFAVPAHAGGPGKSFARNLTPDPGTGIGRTSDHELFGMLTRGIRADGTVLLHPMNLVVRGWSRALSDDAQAVIAYLRAQPPVKNHVRTGTAHAPALPEPPTAAAAAPADTVAAEQQATPAAPTMTPLKARPPSATEGDSTGAGAGSARHRSLGGGQGSAMPSNPMQ